MRRRNDNFVSDFWGNFGEIGANEPQIYFSPNFLNQAMKQVEERYAGILPVKNRQDGGITFQYGRNLAPFLLGAELTDGTVIGINLKTNVVLRKPVAIDPFALDKGYVPGIAIIRLVGQIR